MSIKKIYTGVSMILKMLFRRRIIFLALALLPVLFLTVVEMTASKQMLQFRLAALEKDLYLHQTQRAISLVFFSVTTTGFLVSFFALNLIQSALDVNRRLVICGYRPVELLFSKLLSLFFMILLIAVYIGLLTHLYFPLQHVTMYMISLLLIGFVYGCYGLAVGSIIKGELEGILFIVLLANIDVGWLQNPTLYADAQNKMIIRYLPGYYPSQTGLIAAFTDHSVVTPVVYSMTYGAAFLLLAMVVFSNKMRIRS